MKNLTTPQTEMLSFLFIEVKDAVDYWLPTGREGWNKRTAYSLQKLGLVEVLNDCASGTGWVGVNISVTKEGKEKILAIAKNNKLNKHFAYDLNYYTTQEA